MFLYASMFLSLQWAFKSHAAFTTRLFCRLSARLFSELGLCLVLLGLSTLEALQRAPSEHLTKFSLHKIPAAPPQNNSYPHSSAGVYMPVWFKGDEKGALWFENNSRRKSEGKGGENVKNGAGT